MRSLVLLHDAFGGFGGIAKFNRDLLSGLCSYPAMRAVTALPRHIPGPLEPMPPTREFAREGARGPAAYVATALRRGLTERFDLIVCAHINLLPLAFVAARRSRAPLVLVIHGIDAWTPPRGALARFLAARADFVLSVSEHTTRRFAAWSGIPSDRVLLLPNCVDLAAFTPGPRDPTLAARYGIAGRRVIMTLGRLVSRERAKGMDEVLEVLPALLAEQPDLTYLIAGDGPDRTRLEAKARELGIGERVVFCGRVAEAEKAAHYRLADAYVMPSRGEGFGIVLLEAMACGIPTMASLKDGGREALRDGALGILVDPDDAQYVKAGILECLRRPKGVPPGLDYYSPAAFERRLHAHLDRIVETTTK
jgi:glycosyltransferase involved in cell wall biosynthesis